MKDGEKLLHLKKEIIHVKKVEWILRVAIFGTFLGHGVLALQLNPSFLNYITAMTGISGPLAENLLIAIGYVDIITAVLVIVFPFKLMSVWAFVGLSNSSSKTYSWRTYLGLC